MLKPSRFALLFVVGLLMYAVPNGMANAQNTANELFEQAFDFEQGYLGTVDLEQARKLYQEAAQLNHLESKVRLALLDESTNPTAEQWLIIKDVYQRASTRGSTLAITRLANLYEKGLAGEANLESAIFYYEQAAARGSPQAASSLARLKPAEPVKEAPKPAKAAEPQLVFSLNDTVSTSTKNAEETAPKAQVAEQTEDKKNAPKAAAESAAVEIAEPVKSEPVEPGTVTVAEPVKTELLVKSEPVEPGTVAVVEPAKAEPTETAAAMVAEPAKTEPTAEPVLIETSTVPAVEPSTTKPSIKAAPAEGLNKQDIAILQQILESISAQPEQAWWLNGQLDAMTPAYLLSAQSSEVSKAKLLELVTTKLSRDECATRGAWIALISTLSIQELSKKSAVIIKKQPRRCKTAVFQKLLNELGHYKGKIDGRAGVQTWTAVESFNKTSDKKIAAKITNSTVHELAKSLAQTRRY
jgi:hypothetical protein